MTKGLEMIEKEILDFLELFHRVHSKIEKNSRQVLQKDADNLTMAEAKTLFVIGSSEPKNMKQIAEALGVATSTPTAVMDRLVDKNLVARLTGTEDRRQVLVSLTDQGKALLRELDKNSLEYMKIFLEMLSQKEIAQFRNILVKIDRKLV